eukprot:scaffold721_cov131-Cylindrotheca_fusiformis.AAC.5
MSNIVRPGQPRGQKLILLTVGLLGIAAFRSFVENYDEIPNVASVKKEPETSAARSKSSFSLFDINGPPPASGRQNEESGSLLTFGKAAQQSKNQAKVSETAPISQLGSNASPDLSFINGANDDDGIPRAASGVVQTAAEALICPDSVLVYVISATDLKDECDGLRKVFSQYCAETEAPNIPGDERRRLTESDQMIFHSTTNPLVAWQLWLRDIVESVLLDQSHRHLSEEKKDPGVQVGDSSLDGSPQLKASTKEKQKMQLDIPIKGHRLSQKALSESFYLNQDDKTLRASLMVAQNKTNSTGSGTVSDAAASLKAVSDATDYVSSVLNDPDSVEARTCCTSVLSVYHENCSVDEEEALSDKQLFIVVAVIVVCGLVKSLIRHFQIRWLPEAAGCILVGVLSGYVISYIPHHDLSFDGHWFLRVMVPPIIFEAALSIDKRSFNRHIVPILLYSSIGTLFATLVTAVFVHRVSFIFNCTTLPLIESMTFGALISSIDPIAVLSVLNNMGMSDTDTIYVLIFGESLLNDGVAIVLFETLLHFLDDNMQGDYFAVMAAGIHFMVVAIGSLLVGLGSGICCTLYYWLMHGCQQPLVEILTFCCWALLPYYVCDGIDWSGIVSVVAAGFVMDMFVVGQHHPDEKEDQPGAFEPSTRRRRVRPVFGREGHLSAEAKLHIGFVTEILATTMETAIFAYLGLFLFSSRYHWDFSLAVISIVGCLLGRAVMIPSLSLIANWITKSQQKRASCCSQQLPVSEGLEDPKVPSTTGVVVNKKMQLVLWFAGLRGAMSFALVESIPLYDPATGEGTGLKAELKAMTSACIIFTVFVLGGYTYYMMDSLGMAPSGSNPESSAGEQELVGLLSQNDEEDAAADNFMNPKRPTPPRGNRFRHRVTSD